MSTCPHCSYSNVWNGCHSGGQQKFLCRNCGQQHVQKPQRRCVLEPIREGIYRFLRVKITLREICHTKKVLLPWLLQFIRQINEELTET